MLYSLPSREGKIRLLRSPQTRIVAAVIITMAAEAFAVFANGGYFLGPMTLGVAAFWITLFSLALFNHRELIAALSPAAIIAIVILALLWLWTGISITWSIGADLTWVEFNRTGGYLAVFIIGAVAGASRVARSLAAWLFLLIASAAGAYALGAKAAPAIIENWQNTARLAIPLNYANAVGLLFAMVFPLSLYFSTSRTSHWLVRLFSTLASPLLLIALFFTLSRGAVLALIIGLVVYFAIVPLRLRSFGMMLFSVPAALLVARWSNAQAALMENDVELNLRIASASDLRTYLLYVLLAVGISLLIALIVGKMIRFPKLLTRAVGAIVLVSVLGSAAVGAFLFVNSKPSFSGWLEETKKSITKKPTELEDATTIRLLVLNSDYRWQVWEEAIANWEDSPVAGTGAQTFPLVHLMRREEGIPFMKQAHSLPFGILSELGVVGFALMGLFIAFTLTVALLRTYKITDRWQQGLAQALFAMTVIYLIHTSYDWDWNMFALTTPYFFFTGLLVSWRAEPGGPAFTLDRVAPQQLHECLAQSSLGESVKYHGLHGKEPLSPGHPDDETADVSRAVEPRQIPSAQEAWKPPEV